MKTLCMSDLHLSSVRPMCRTDADWVKTQQEHLDFVLNYAGKNGIGRVIIAGDIFDTPTVTPTVMHIMMKFILSLREMGCAVHFIAGNHDLPYHAAERVVNCSFGVLSLIREDACDDIAGYDFGVDVPEDTTCSVLVLHTFTVQDEKHRVPTRDCHTARELTEKYSKVTMIVTGDNHENFCVHENNCWVVNCGTFIQRTAAEAKRPCGFWVVDDSSSRKPEYIDLSHLSEGKIDTSYLEDIKEREDNRAQYEALISELKDGTENKYDFVALLNEYLSMHEKDIDESVYNILMKTAEYIRSA